MILLFSNQAMARWTVKQLFPDNLDYPSKLFNIQVETNGSMSFFTVTVSAKEKLPFPAKSSVWLRIMNYSLERGIEMIAICPIMYEEKKDLRIFEFSVVKKYLEESTFSYSEPYKGKMSRLGGCMYSFRLGDFIKTKQNKVDGADKLTKLN